MRLPHLLMALHVFGTDVQQGDCGRTTGAVRVHGRIISSAENGELDQLVGVAIEVRADIQNRSDTA